MLASARFECSSASLTLKALLKRSRKALYIGLGLAVALHAFLSQVRGPAEENKAAKPLTTQFIKRQPRLTKPLELKKLPRPKQRRVQRRMVAVTARARGYREVSRIQTAQVTRSLARPVIHVRRGAAFQATGMEPRAFAGLVQGQKEAKELVDMSLEMLDVEALDTGRHQAMIIQDPQDKRNIRGFFHLAMVYIPSLAELNKEYALGTQFSATPLALPALVDAMNKYTQIRTDMKGTYPIDSQEVLEVPWIMIIPTYNFKLADREALNLGRYLMSGGFLYGDDGRHNIASVSFQGLHEMYYDALGTQGLRRDRDFTIAKIPQDHEIYHCYFDFDTPPYGTDDHAERDTHGRNTQVYMGVPYAVQYILGVTVDERLVGTINPKSYGWVWECAIVGDVRDGGAKHVDYARSLQLGVNMIVFALTQEGSVTNRVMDRVSR